MTPGTSTSPTMSLPTPTPSTSASTRPTTTAGPTSSRRSSAPCAAPPRQPVPSSLCSRTCTCTARAPGRFMRPPWSTRTSAKSRTRAAMSAELLDAHRRGEVRIAHRSGRGLRRPCVRDSALGQFVFQPSLAGKRAQTIGRPDAKHTYSYVPDVGRNRVLLGSAQRRLRPGVAPAEPRDVHHPAPSSSTCTPPPGSAAPVSLPSTGRCRDCSGCSNRNVRELPAHTTTSSPRVVHCGRLGVPRHVRRPRDELAPTSSRAPSTGIAAHVTQPEYSHGLAEATTLRLGRMMSLDRLLPGNAEGESNVA